MLRTAGVRTLLALAAAATALPAQHAREASRPRIAEAEARVAGWKKQLREFAPAWHWLADGGLCYHDPRPGQPPFVHLDRTGAMRRAATREALGVSDEPSLLAPARGYGASGPSSGPASVTFVNEFDRPVRLFWVDGDGQAREYGVLAAGARREQSTFAGHVWLGDFAANDLAGAFVATAGKGTAVFGPASRQALEKPPEPERAARLRIADHQVVALWPDGTETTLTTGGRAGDPYRLPRHWSPTGDRVLGFQVEPGEERTLTLVDSSPKDQLQPKVSTHSYPKPGDRIDRPRPRLFDLALRREVPIDDAAFVDAWAIDEVRWSPDGATVYCRYNRRGHQLLRMLAIDAATGSVRTVVEEKSDTFVDWSQKSFVHWLADGERFLWTSERDGHNHLWLVDARTGALQQLTRGDWVVRRVEHVDEQAAAVWLCAYGFHRGQDPYHAHLLRVPLAGGEPVALTSADGTHEWTFSPDRSLLLVRHSRVDRPWTTELRSATDGRLLATLGEDDASAAVAAGMRHPERFVAKGRDGTTDIHGILILPSDFDPQRRYPVVEQIYAGPHGHFVPKAFALLQKQRELAELGFVVVQIDGMGTNWRSKAFHDVCWRNLGDSGFPDRIVWLREAAATRPWLDLTRVGIYGGSAGGQSALAALLHHGDFYRAAVADCGCHDNRMDKIWWNEAWMGWPVGPWYADNSNVTHAEKLRGALLLTVGEVDRNVDPASTMQVVRALLDHDKEFDWLVVPSAGHGAGEAPWLDRRRKQFFVEHLGGPVTRGGDGSR